MIRVTVELPGGRSYPVLVGPGVVGELASVLPTGVRRVAVVTQESVPVEVDPGVDHRVFRIGDGETAKSLSTVEELCSAFAGWGLTRADAVVGVGGGVVTDVAGFAAASYHRGLPVVHVATTLLAQIDAAIGGKTGVNIPEGKNLVGAFWQPAAVLCDTTVLETLPEREMACGLGEMAKYHFLGGGDLGGGDLGGGDSGGLTLEQRVARCVQIKAEVVAADEREAGRRAILNYGHTLGHALETTGRYDLRHGEAVAVGLVYAAELALALGRIDDERVAEHRRVVDGYGLSGSLPAGADPDELMAAMGRDKKAIDGLTFVLDGPAGVEVVAGVDARVVLDPIESVPFPPHPGRPRPRPPGPDPGSLAAWQSAGIAPGRSPSGRIRRSGQGFAARHGRSHPRSRAPRTPLRATRARQCRRTSERRTRYSAYGVPVRRPQRFSWRSDPGSNRASPPTGWTRSCTMRQSHAVATRAR